MYAYIALCHYLKLKEGKGWRKRDVNILLTRFIRIRVGEREISSTRIEPVSLGLCQAEI